MLTTYSSQWAHSASTFFEKPHIHTEQSKRIYRNFGSTTSKSSAALLQSAPKPRIPHRPGCRSSDCQWAPDSLGSAPLPAAGDLRCSAHRVAPRCLHLRPMGQCDWDFSSAGFIKQPPSLNLETVRLISYFFWKLENYRRMQSHLDLILPIFINHGHSHNCNL